LKKFYQENDSEEFQVGFWRYLDRFWEFEIVIGDFLIDFGKFSSSKA
jgi:hypothetical protein